MTGFLNSPIANSANPDANPAEGVMHLPRVEVAYREVAPTVSGVTLKHNSTSVHFGACADGYRLLYRVARNGSGITTTYVSLADAEAFADGINALVRQMRREAAK